MFYGKVKSKGINMKSNKGITLASLTLYIVVMIIVLGIMSSIISTFYSNTEGMNAKVQELVEFNKFNTNFLKEVKSYNNSVDSIADDATYILFTSGNSFSFSNNKIYYNNLKIASDVKKVTFKKDEDDDTIIEVSVEFESFSKTIKYKLENIY